MALTPDDTRYAVPLTPTSEDQLFVRLTLDPTIATPLIDNVGIEVAAVPEPRTAETLAFGAAWVWGLNRLRAKRPGRT